MTRLQLCITSILTAACGSRGAPTAEVATPPAPPPSAPRTHADIGPAWLTAVNAQDATAIDAMLGLPLTLYYDDNWTGKRPAECEPVRVVREIRTEAERTAVVACVVQTVRASTSHLATEPLGIWDVARLVPAMPEPVQAPLVALAPDHVFVRGPSIAAGDYDFTLVLPKSGTQARMLVLWTING